MSGLTDICHVCLRTGRNFKFLDSDLSYYYMELTDYVLVTAQTPLCLECEYQLKKSYNFKQKCLKASKILQEWKETKIGAKEPLNNLHTHLPPHNLTMWREDNNKVFSYCWEETGLSSMVTDQCLTTPRLMESDNEEPVEDTIPDAEIKLENESDIDSEDISLQELITYKFEESEKALQDILIQNNDDLNNIQQSENIEDIFENNESEQLNNIQQSENIDDIFENNESEQNIEMPDDASLNSDDDYDFAKEISEQRKRKKSLLELTNVSLTSDDCGSEPEKAKMNTTKMSMDDTFILSCARGEKIFAKLKTVSEDLDFINDNWQSSFEDMPESALSRDARDKVLKSKKANLTLISSIMDNDRKRGVVNQLVALNKELDTIHSDCESIANYQEGLKKPKESLKAELMAKLANCGELKTEKGFVVDKDAIMKCYYRVSECLMRRLFRFVHGKETFDQRAIRLLQRIQIKYQNEQQYESVFDIEHLDTREKVMEEFHVKRKTYEWYKKAKYKCEMCNLGFKYEIQLHHHLDGHKESAGKFACEICGVRLKNKKSFTSHAKSHEAVFKCRLCPLITYYRSSVKNHYCQHLGVLYQCEICMKIFKSNSAKATHIGRFHRKAFSVTSQSDRQADGDTLSANATGGTSFTCKQCDHSFTSREACMMHARNAHPRTNKMKSDRPRKVAIFECRVCNAVGKSIGWLNAHFSAEHPSTDMALYYTDRLTHLCHVCGKAFASVYNLRDHINTHTGERPYVCSLCGARFHRSFALAEHRRTHLPPTRGCSHCGKKFRSKANLYNHVKTHIGNRCYKCSICGKGFLHRNALNEHVRGVHHKLRRVRKRGEGKQVSGDDSS